MEEEHSGERRSGRVLISAERCIFRRGNWTVFAPVWSYRFAEHRMICHYLQRFEIKKSAKSKLRCSAKHPSPENNLALKRTQTDDIVKN
jgi:hypothetical protein